VVILQRHHAVANENDYTVVDERSLDDELALLLADNAEFDTNYIADYSIDLVSVSFKHTLGYKFIFHIAFYTLI
jgi:hypothetical protein